MASVSKDAHVAKPATHGMFRDFWMGGLASSLATLVSNPIEVCKTRLQLEGELQTKQAEKNTRRYRGMFNAFTTIARTEGIRGLQGGLSAAIGFQIMMNGTRLGLYDFVNRSIRGDRKAGEDYFFLKNMGVAAIVGGTGAFLGNPFFLVKVRLQVANKTLQQVAATTSAVATPPGAAVTPSASESIPRPLGTQYHYKGLWDGLVSIVRNEGFLGLWRNSHIAMIRVTLGSAAQLSCYDSIKHFISTSPYVPQLIREGPPLHIASSMTAAGIVACAMNPADVIVTRLYNQDQGAKLYSSASDCIRKMYQSEGIRGFFKGLPAHYARLGPHTVLTFTIWEEIKKLNAQWSQ